jgi:signal transduction histidine kinase/CheY-like chemotaxis protein
MKPSQRSANLFCLQLRIVFGVLFVLAVSHVSSVSAQPLFSQPVPLSCAQASNGLDEQLDVNEAQTAEANANNNTRVTTVLYWLLGVVLLGVFSLMFALVKVRNRFQTVKRQLAEEKETSRLNRELRDVLQERVARLQRMESLGMLAGGIAHDFNNLLVGVMCNAELLEMQSNNFDNFSMDRLRRIIDSADKAADLSRQMLAYTGKQQIEKCPVDLNQVIKKMTRILEASVGETIELSFDLSKHALIVDGDETQIEQIILNLVANSRNASDENGKILIRTGTESIERSDSDQMLFGERENGGEFVFFEVKDFGRGFEESNLDQIFEPFYSSGEDGRGLGLSVVYGVVNEHDGLISVCTNADRGTRFRILLPPSTSATAVQHVNQPNFSTAKAASSNFKGTVLVVDDEDTVRDLICVLLERAGWKVESVENGELAVEILKREADRFECIALDILMPVMGAEQVLQELDRASIRLPIVLMSGYSETRLGEFRKNKNITEIVSKPFRAANFLEVIDAAASTRRRKPISRPPIAG